MSLHHIHIKPRDKSNRVLSGVNTIILIDGKELQGVMRATFQVEAGNVATLTIKMVGNLELEGEIETEVGL